MIYRPLVDPNERSKAAKARDRYSFCFDRNGSIYFDEPFIEDNLEIRIKREENEMR